MIIEIAKIIDRIIPAITLSIFLNKMIPTIEHIAIVISANVK